MRVKYLLINSNNSLQKHIELGGTIHDFAGAGYLADYLRAVSMDIDARGEAANLFSSINLTQEELGNIVVSMIDELMPNPCVVAQKKDTLITTAMFFDERLLAMFALQLRRHLGEPFPASRAWTISLHSQATARELKETFDKTYGESSFSIKDSGGLQHRQGCATPVLIAGLIPALYLLLK